MIPEPDILVVDDSPEALALLVKALGSAGYRVRPADSGELALAAVAASPPDLILLDVRMKGMDGLEVCRRLAVDPATRRIPVILISAFAGTDEWVRGLQSGAVDYITKPFRNEELLARVRTHLALRKAEDTVALQTASLLRADERRWREAREREVLEGALFLCREGAEPRRRALTSALEELEQSQQARRESDDLCRMLVENTADVILVLDIENDSFRTVSPSVERLRGTTAQEALTEGFLPSLAPTSRETMRSVLPGRLEQFRLGKEQLFVDEIEQHHNAGHDVWTEVTWRLVLNRATGRVEAIGVSRDISRRKRAEAVHASLEEQLRTSQKMEAIGSLAGGVAHDFNNLLSIILTYTELAIEAQPESSPVRADLLEVQRAGERAATLTRQLLAFSRKQVLQPVVLDLNQAAARVEKMLRRILGEDIDYVQKLAPDLGVVRADPGQVEQVMMNLAVNARDAMPGGGQLTVETANVQVDEEYAASHIDLTPGPYIMLAVTDTGCGMDEQTRARIFEPFFTTKEKGRGTGLGLSTVYGIVKQSSGDIWVYSEQGKGTTFRIYLPREPGELAAECVPARVPGRLTGTETILLVEDEQALRAVAVRSLAEAGYTVLAAADGEEALGISARHGGDIQILVTDVVMPRMGGRALAERLQKTRPDIAVLFVSGFSNDAIVHHGALDHDARFLAKPFTAAELTRKVRETLDIDLTDPGAGGGQGIEAEALEPPPDPKALAALPAELLERLHRAATAARFGEIVAITEAIRVTDPGLAAGLRRLADRFDYAEIRGLVER